MKFLKLCLQNSTEAMIDINLDILRNIEKSYSQSASSRKAIQKLTFVLSRSAPIRRSGRLVQASSLPDSFINVMAVVKREIWCLNLFRIVACTCLEYNIDH